MSLDSLKLVFDKLSDITGVPAKANEPVYCVVILGEYKLVPGIWREFTQICRTSYRILNSLKRLLCCFFFYFKQAKSSPLGIKTSLV